MAYFQNSNPVSADIIPQRQPYSEFSPTSTLPSIKIRFPSLPSSMLVRRLILWTTESFSNVFPLHTDSPVWRTHGWSRTSLAENISFTLATATHLHPRFSIWRSSGISIRTSFICPVHIGCSQTCRGTWTWCSPLCR